MDGIFVCHFCLTLVYSTINNNTFLYFFIYKVLNVQGNKLKALPAAIGNLSSLQSLILQGLIFFQSHHPTFPGQLIMLPMNMLFFFDRK